jgi:16S rRNA processing protein RimM
VSKPVSRLIPLGRVAGHRGLGGELTVKIFRGEAVHWNELSRVWLNKDKGTEASFEIERSRAYKDRLVLKLAGVEDANAAEELRGSEVAVEVEDAPVLPEGQHYAAVLVGMEVRDEEDRIVGTVIDVMPTGGKDVLMIAPAVRSSEESGDDREILVPLAEEIAVVDEAARVIRIRPPEGLLDLNRG